jgi:hypothetical protein
VVTVWNWIDNVLTSSVCIVIITVCWIVRWTCGINKEKNILGSSVWNGLISRAVVELCDINMGKGSTLKLGLSIIDRELLQCWEVNLPTPSCYWILISSQLIGINNKHLKLIKGRQSFLRNQLEVIFSSTVKFICNGQHNKLPRHDGFIVIRLWSVSADTCFHHAPGILRGAYIDHLFCGWMWMCEW